METLTSTTFSNLVSILNYCQGKELNPFLSTLGQTEYSTISWLADSYIKHSGSDQSEWQHEMYQGIYDANKIVSVPELVITRDDGIKGAPGKLKDPKQLSTETPYVFFIKDKFGVEYKMSVVGALGVPGKEGTTYRVIMEDPTLPSLRKTCAMKVFKGQKSMARINTEAMWQQTAAKCGIAPKVYGVIEKGAKLDKTGGKILMGLAAERVQDRIERQGGILTPAQQWSFLTTALEMDECGVYHNDPNQLNFMFDTMHTDNVVWIDYGFSKQIDPKKNGSNPNFRSLWTFLHGGMQGLVTRGILQEYPHIMDAWLEHKDTMTPKDNAAIKNHEMPTR